MIYESDYYLGSDLGGDSLSHHGVPHQKWGVKNGPPYPIASGHTVRYNTGKMTDKTRENLQKAGKIAKSAGATVKSALSGWKDQKKADLTIKDTNSALMKSWQKRQLRISDMSNQELKDRTERKKLEEGYRRALRGDFTEPKTWKGVQSNNDGKKIADNILRKFGEAAVAGLTAGLTKKIETTMVTKAQRKVARREAHRDAMAEVSRNAAKERKQQRADDRAYNGRTFDGSSRYVGRDVYNDYTARLTSGNSDMDDLWDRYGPRV